MNGRVNNGVWVRVERPKGKTVLVTETLFKRKTGKDGQIEKYTTLQYPELSSLTSTAASMRVVLVLATASVEDWELRHLDVEDAYLQADIDEAIYIGLPEDYGVSPNAVGLLRKAMHGSAQSGLWWIPNAHRWHQREWHRAISRSLMCIHRKSIGVEAVAVIVVYVNYILLELRQRTTMSEQCPASVHACFDMKDLVEAEFYLGCHITRGREARTLGFQPTHIC